MSIEAMKQALEALYSGDLDQQSWAKTNLMRAIRDAEKQEPVALEWDEVYDAAASAYCRSEASRKALRLCFQTRDQTTQISIGWTANELMAFAKTIAYVCTTPPTAQREFVGLTQQDIDIAFDDTQEGGGFNEFARAIEQTLRRKNT